MLAPTGTASRLKLTIAAISMAAILAGLTGAWALGPVQSGARDVTEFTVQPGWGSMRIADELGRVALIRSPLVFTVYVRLSGIGGELQAGTYVLSQGMTPIAIAALMAQGKALPTDIEVTIPEGKNVWEIDGILFAKKLIVAGSFARTWQTEEGRLFPDTYRFPLELASTSAQFANARAVGQVLRDAFEQKARKYSPEQLIIASILEKEAKTAEDMALVSGIIAKRRSIGMALQVDATVGYGWCLSPRRPMSSTANCDVTQAPIVSEIKVDGPYNTYTRQGLPAGPISNPGLKALDAAVHPKASDYLYYLSTRDGSMLVYSRTLEEHLENRQKHLGF